MLYITQDLKLFSDKHYRNEAIDDLQRLIDEGNKHGKKFKLELHNDFAPYIIICAHDYGYIWNYGGGNTVGRDYDYEKWKAACREQSIEGIAADTVAIKFAESVAESVAQEKVEWAEKLMEKYKTGMKLKEIDTGKIFEINAVNKEHHRVTIKNKSWVANVSRETLEKSYEIIEEYKGKFKTGDYVKIKKTSTRGRIDSFNGEVILVDTGGRYNSYYKENELELLVESNVAPVTEFKYEIGDEVVTSSGYAAKIINGKRVDGENLYKLDYHVENMKDAWESEEEIMRRDFKNKGLVDLQKYIEDCCRTECEYSDATLRASEYIDLLHGSIGLCTEIGELQDQVKRFVFYGKDLDIVNVAEEIGDICWYLSIVCKSLKLDWQKILEKNIEKLKKRYPEKFSSEEALNRNLDEERKVLE